MTHLCRVLRLHAKVMSATSAFAIIGFAFATATLLAVQNSQSASLTASAGDHTSGFPDATTTGVPRDLALRPSESITIDTAGTVVSDIDVRGEVVISAPNVTLKNCRVTSASFVAVWVVAPGARIEDCEIVSAYLSGGTKGIYFDSAADDALVRRCDIHSVEDGVYISARNIVIEDSYIHDLASGGVDPHYDGIQLHGDVSGDVVIRHNAVITRWSDNSAITTGVVQNVLVEGNKLYGGGYTVRIDGRFGEGVVSGVSIVNNRFGPHEAGYWSFDKSDPVVSGNVNDSTGVPIP
jgi:nitrous oxidase accessory protein NosD